MAFKPMSPQERASIEAQVLIKAGAELAVAEIANGDEGVAVTMAIDNAKALAQAMPALKQELEGSIVATTTATAMRAITDTFGEVEAVAPQQQAQAPVNAGGARPSMYIDDSEYSLVHRLFLFEKQAGIAYGSKDSFFMDNQAIRKLFQDGQRQFPADYWAESMRGKDIPITKNGKCGLGDFRVKKGVTAAEDGTFYVAQGEGTYGVANKSGYFGALVKHTPFNWAERPQPLDPQGWLVGADG
jgi:hypothetical protein